VLLESAISVEVCVHFSCTTDYSLYLLLPMDLKVLLLMHLYVAVPAGGT